MGGGRTLSANATRRCWAETGADWKINGRTNVCLGKTDVACGETECAATQTVHFAASFAPEWWCVTSATAEHKVSSRHSHAIRFENDRITMTTKVRFLKSYTEDASQRNRQSENQARW